MYILYYMNMNNQNAALKVIPYNVLMYIIIVTHLWLG